MTADGDIQDLWPKPDVLPDVEREPGMSERIDLYTREGGELKAEIEAEQREPAAIGTEIQQSHLPWQLHFLEQFPIHRARNAITGAVLISRQMVDEELKPALRIDRPAQLTTQQSLAERQKHPVELGDGAQAGESIGELLKHEIRLSKLRRGDLS